MFEALTLILIHAISGEAPTIETNSRYDGWKAGYVGLLDTDQKIVNESDDFLVNADVDLDIIATIQLFESRINPSPKDGDCRNTYYKQGGQNIIKQNCRSVGSMQISKGAVQWAKNINGQEFKELTINKLREPEMNVRVGYSVLKNFKSLCKSNLPGVWLTAFGEGHCPKNNQLDAEGLRRCAVLTAELNASGNLPPNWKCGHEGKKMQDKTALKFIAKIAELNKDDQDQNSELDQMASQVKN
jgi:hypothetical protein